MSSSYWSMGKSRFLGIGLMLLCAGFSQAQVNRYIVFFRDKANSNYSTTQPIAYLSQAAIDRRTKNEVLITEEDLPVNASYIDQVKQKGAHIVHKSKWFNAVLIQVDQSIIPSIEALAPVLKVELVAPGQFTGARSNTSHLSTRVHSSTSIKTVA